MTDWQIETIKNLKWKSVDKDNMEFELRTTYSVVDAIREMVKEIENHKAN